MHLCLVKLSPIICIADLVFTPHTPCSPRNVNFFNALSYLVFNRSKVSKGMLKNFVWPFPRPTVLHCGIDCLHGSLVAFFQKPHFPLTKFRSINKLRRQWRLVRKCRSRLHWIARVVVLLLVDLDRRCVVRIWDLSHSHCHIQTADHTNANRSYR